MPKRRRERDRPKSGPESLYNPNKRVLLSYASDNDEEEVPDATQQDGSTLLVNERQIANYQIDEYPNDDDEAKSDHEQEAQAGGEDDSGDADQATDQQVEAFEGDDGYDDYTHQSVNKNGSRKVRRNQTTNQIPSLGLISFQWDDEDEDEYYESETEEAMAYLRAVRSERQNIPEILTASRHVNTIADASADTSATSPDTIAKDDPIQAEVRPGNGGDACEATPVPALKDDLLDPQKAFDQSLTDRFNTQRNRLREPPNIEALSALGPEHPISFPRGNNKAYAEWYRLISTKAPRCAQLQALQEETVSDLLALLQKHYLHKERNINNITSAWLWSLLAKLDEVGTMTNDQVFPLRELGKRAIFLQLHDVDPEAAAVLEGDEPSDGVPGATSEDEIALEEDPDVVTEAPDLSLPVTACESTVTPPTSLTQNTKATLDMILVIVGEVFGQRDLLEFRQRWNPVGPAT